MKILILPCLVLWCWFFFCLMFRQMAARVFCSPITCWFSSFCISSLLSCRSLRRLSINGWATEPKMLEMSPPFLHQHHFPLAEVLKMNLSQCVSLIRSKSRCQGWIWLITLSPCENNPHHPLRCFDSCPYLATCSFVIFAHFHVFN